MNDTNTVLLALIAAFVTLATPAITVWATSQTRRAEREEDRKDRAARNAQLAKIQATGVATHAIVNNQRTVMLRAIAILARRIATDHPEDMALQKAAKDAEGDLAENERLNSNPETKPDTQ